MDARSALPPITLEGRVIDFAAGVLRDAEGRPLPLRPQAWAVLRLLAAEPGRVVTKDELFDTVWPGLVVTDGSIAQAVSDIREALGEAGHQLLKTVPRRGYRFDLPPPRASGVPAPPAPLVGRAAELAQLAEMLQQHRLVSLTGPGGVGKTACAQALVHELPGRLVARVAWVDLAPLADAAMLAPAIALALGLPVVQQGDARAALARALPPSPLLLVLDNAEHLVDAVAALVRLLLDGNAALRVLVTSQAPLAIEGERVLRLGPLALPVEGCDWADAARVPAVAMFVEQARAADAAFALGAHNLPAVVRICRGVEGLPLAIRLAAARLPLFGIEGLAARLDERFELLSVAGRDAPPRQRALGAALAWSHSLLDEGDRRLLEQLGVFAGGFTPALVARMAGRDAWATADALGRLVDRSLVERAAAGRLRLLESTREFALRELARVPGALDDARGRHARAMAAMLGEASAEVWRVSDTAWLARWAVELDNARAALAWSREHDPETCAALVGVPSLFALQGLGYELRRHGESLTEDRVAAMPPAVQMGYWLAMAQLHVGLSSERVRQMAVRAEALARQLGDRHALLLALLQQVATGLLDDGEAQARLAECRRLEPPEAPLRVRNALPLATMIAHAAARRWRESQAAAEEGLLLARAAGVAVTFGSFVNGLVVALASQGETAAALARAEELMPEMESVLPAMRQRLKGTVARCALDAGDPVRARRELGAMFGMARQVDWEGFDHFALLYTRLAQLEGRLEAAARLCGFAEVAIARSWTEGAQAARLAAARVPLAAALGAERLAALEAEGRALEREQVCALVLAG